MKNRTLFFVGCLTLIMPLTGLVSSCYQPAVSDQTSLASPMSVVEGEPITSAEPSTHDIHDIDVTGYKLVVTGLVDTPLSETYDSILEYPTVIRTVKLYCDLLLVSDNEWTGVQVSTLLTEAGIKPEAQLVISHAVDDYSGSLSLTNIMKDSVFLAYLVGGQKLSKGDGYPLRLVADGQNGANWVRWVTGIEVK
jgi:DMSO/TMAO reductase YedYZ molybdopterin-dependent catalytic subunit